MNDLLSLHSIVIVHIHRPHYLLVHYYYHKLTVKMCNDNNNLHYHLQNNNHHHYCLGTEPLVQELSILCNLRGKIHHKRLYQIAFCIKDIQVCAWTTLVNILGKRNVCNSRNICLHKLLNKLSRRHQFF